MEAEVVLEHRNRRCPYRRLECGQELGLADDQRGRPEPPGRETVRPGDRWRVTRGQISRRHLVVILLWVAKPLELTWRSRERRLETHDFLGRLVSAIGAAHKSKHPCHVSDILGPRLDHASFLIEVVVTIWQAQAALLHMH